MAKINIKKIGGKKTVEFLFTDAEISIRVFKAAIINVESYYTYVQGAKGNDV